MELQHASLDQVRRGRDGRTILVEADVLDVVRQIRELDPNLKVHYNEFGDYYSIAETCQDGRERLVTTVNNLDQRLLEHLRKIGHASWDAGVEMERQDQAHDHEVEHRLHEQIGDRAEHLAHALRKDLEAKNKIFVPKGV